MLQKRRLIGISIIGTALLLVILVFVVPSIQHRGKIGVKVAVIPEDSTLWLDGKKTRAGTVYMTPGKHTLKATREYFTDITKAVDTSKINPKEPITLMPKPDSDEALQYLERHPKEQKKREAVAGSEVAKQQKILEKAPLLDKLPYSGAGLEYIIDYDAKPKDDSSIEVIYYIRASNEEGRQAARQWIVDQGVDPEKLTIEYLANPYQDNPSVGHQ